jgi:hypothetical protein
VKVFVVTAGEYDETYVLALFSTMAKAKTYADRFNEMKKEKRIDRAAVQYEIDLDFEPRIIQDHGIRPGSAD